MSSEQYIGPSVDKKKFEEMLERGVLLDGETVQAAIWGSIESSRIPLEGSRGQHKEIDLTVKMLSLDKRSGLLGLTDQRVIFYMPKMMNRYEFEAYQLTQIDSIQFTKGMRKGRIDVTIVNNNRVIKGIDNEEGKIIVDRIQVATRKTKESANTSTVVSEKQSPIDALKMKYINGEISEEEFEKKKKVIEGL